MELSTDSGRVFSTGGRGPSIESKPREWGGGERRPEFTKRKPRATESAPSVEGPDGRRSSPRCVAFISSMDMPTPAPIIVGKG